MQVSTRHHSRVELPGMQGQSIPNLRQAHLGAWRVQAAQCPLARFGVRRWGQWTKRRSSPGALRANGWHAA